MPCATRSIVLIGFMGSGKSSVGRCLARRLRWARFDTDQMISREIGMTISEIFERHGEEFFRDAEMRALEKIDINAPAIVVTGGGAVLHPENVRRMRELGAIVWLDADLDTLEQRLARRDDRPLLQTGGPRLTIEKLLAERCHFYESAAEIRIDTSALNHEQVAKEILHAVGIER